MSVVEDTRKLPQDFLAPELRELKGRIDSLGPNGYAGDENTRNFEELNAKLNLLLNLHSIERRLA